MQYTNQPVPQQTPNTIRPKSNICQQYVSILVYTLMIRPKLTLSPFCWVGVSVSLDRAKECKKDRII